MGERPENASMQMKITSHEATKWYEEMARLILEYAYPEYKDHFRSGPGVERPDLQNEIDDIGVEVARTTPEVENMSQAFLLAHVKEDMTDQEVGELNKLAKYGAVFQRNGTILVEPVRQVMSMAYYEKEAACVIQRKKSNVSDEGYKRYAGNDLFLFMHTLMDAGNIPEIIESAGGIQPFTRIHFFFGEQLVTIGANRQQDGKIPDAFYREADQQARENIIKWRKK